MILMLFKCYFLNYYDKTINVIYIKMIIQIMKIKEETKVRNQGEISLITTIPKTYVKALDIESGDTIEWTLNTETETLELKIVK